eukprot:3854020-Rhodomonas_salina.1
MRSRPECPVVVATLGVPRGSHAALAFSMCLLFSAPTRLGFLGAVSGAGEQLEERDSKNKPGECLDGVAAYNPWALTVESYLAK